MSRSDTIVALSTGALPSGIAVVRISGSKTYDLLKLHGINAGSARVAALVSIKHSKTGVVLDKGICIHFPGPNSFTGEDSAELHLHGGKAVVGAVLETLTGVSDVRLAEPGEFSRRGFENGKFDLTEIEGLSDLISAETEAQRVLALGQAGGSLRLMYEGWRTRIIEMLAMMEAEIDFVDEDDVPEDAGDLGLDRVKSLASEIRKHLDDNQAGEIIRDGFRVAIMGPPNAGKSSLLNTLAKRDVAIVTDQAGTTRDVLDVHLNVAGYEVIVSDTAGIREAEDVVELEGIRRAKTREQEADMVIWLEHIDGSSVQDVEMQSDRVLTLKSKDDVGSMPAGTSISSTTGHGIEWLLGDIEHRINARVVGRELGIITRHRYRVGLEACVERLEEAVRFDRNALELSADALRSAGDALGRITGRIDVEDLLDVIFSEFCVGK
ncbi:MAG: tRNA uridine-5-carboxymethylaminomethyl(34) synthesis GTPase MnmE [Pseudomonadota bacterium]